VSEVTAEGAVILRPGGITGDVIRSAIGTVRPAASDAELSRSPGTRHKHYSPRARLVLIERGSADFIRRVCIDFLNKGRVGFLGHAPVGITHPQFAEIRIGPTSRDYAVAIYACLRRLDESNPDVIVVQGIELAGEGEAVMDRLRRAASEVVAE